MRAVWHTTACLAVVVLLSACEDKEVTDLAFATVQQAAAQGDAGFKSYFEQVKGKRVAWKGQVVEAQRQFEDDYMETGLLLVEVDGAGEPKGDVSFKIPPSRLDEFSPGKAVSFTAVLREYELKSGALLLKMEMKELQ